MRQNTRGMSRMAVAAFVAAAGVGPVIDSLDDHANTSGLTIAPGMENPTELADPDLPTDRAAKLARRWSRAAMMVEGPQAPTMYSRRNPTAKHQRNCGRQGDHRPRLRRGRFW